MAATDSLPHHLICQLCSKLYSDPRILPCLHSFCCQCLHNEIEKVGRPQKSILCPICRRSAPIPVGGASVLPPNLHLEFEVDVAEYMAMFASDSRLYCNFCINGCTDLAVVFCCSCRQFMCSFGQTSHKRVPQLSQHKLIEVDKELAALLPTLATRTYERKADLLLQDL